MSRKKPSLSGMLTVTEPPALDDLAGLEKGDNKQELKTDGRATINLTVTPSLKKQFKAWCVEADISQVDAFKEAFELLRNSPKYKGLTK